MSGWRSRIVGSGEARPEDLEPHPLNWRRHPDIQEEALEAALERVGWVQQVIVNRRTGRLLDGHLRVELARRRGEPSVPVLYVDLDEGEEALVLATLDPLAGLAEASYAELARLRDMIPDNAPPELEAVISDALDEARQAAIAAAKAELEPPQATLAERFGAPPLTVLDSRQGYWQERKRWWIELGIEPELGRGQRLLGDTTGSRAAMFVVGALGAPGGGTSLFDPVLAELAYRWFAPAGGHILDPFAGGSVRGVVAAVLGYRYTGIELREEQVRANELVAERILTDEQRERVQWIIGGSRELDRLLPEGEMYDMIFTCPPYYDLEVYSDDPADLSNMSWDEFADAYRAIALAAVRRLRPGRFAAYVVGDVRDRRGLFRGLVPLTIRALEEAGAAYYNEAVYVMPVSGVRMRAAHHFRASRKLARVHQSVVVGYYGDPRPESIRAALGDPEGVTDTDAEAADGE